MVGKIPKRVGLGLVILLFAIVILFFVAGFEVDFINGAGHTPPVIVQEPVENNEESITVSPSPLIAEANADPNCGQAPLKVNFTGSAIGGTPPLIFEWDFNHRGYKSY
jgi:PKD repeat protein